MTNEPAHHGAAWLDNRADIETSSVVLPARASAAAPAQGSAWLDTSDIEPTPPPRPRRLSVARWAAAAGLAVTAAALAGAVISNALTAREPARSLPPVTVPSTPVSSSPAHTGSKACQALTGDVVGDGPGDTVTMVGAILRFEHAYYVRRDPDLALAATAPEAGLHRDALAAAITALPAGTTHCVAVTVRTEALAEVHLAEQHPDGRRMDYLQLINVAPGPSGLVIVNIQKRGG